uniref:CNNM transmembrane domain-containing protein n=1 Tax=Theileria annulata TaxID=5874 RepID=A0A3B0MMS5_THEAN
MPQCYKLISNCFNCKMQKWAKILATIVCSALSALFSGLTIGYTSIDLFQLHLLSQFTPTTKEDIANQKRARKIIPLRSDPNNLMIALIACNAMINSLLVLFVGELFEFAMGFIVSSLIVTIFGEIFPQTVFFRYQLQLCSFFAPLTFVVKYVLYPITKPMSMLLNLIIGTNTEVIYNKQQWKALVDLQKECGGVLSEEEAKLLKGCLSLSNVQIDSIMTPIDKVFGLDIDSVITISLIQEIAKEGYSKIPVMDKTKTQPIVAILLIKDLLLLDPNSSYQLDELLSTIGKPAYAVDHDIGLLSVLMHFKDDQTHIAVVRKVEYQNNSDPLYKHIGIVTLNDIFQMINQDETGEIVMTTGDSVERSRHRSRIFKILDNLKDPRSFNLNSILDILPIQEPENLLKLLRLPINPDNLDKINQHRIYLIKPQVFLPTHSLTIITKGIVTDEDNKCKFEAPFVINQKKAKLTYENEVFVTLTECHLIQINPDLLISTTQVPTKHLNNTNNLNISQ